MKNKSWNFLAQKKVQKGFTLIELLIVVAIVVILTAITLGSLTRSQDQQVFNNNFQKIYSLINTARSLAISGKGQLDYTDFDNDGCTDSAAASGSTCTFPDYVTPVNYGVFFNNKVGAPRNVTLFADMNLPTSGTVTGHKGQYDAGGSYATGDDVDLDNLVLPSSLTLELQDDVTGPGEPKPANSFGAAFYSPNYADITFHNFAPNPFLIVRLKDSTNASICQQIRIHKLAGIPEIEPCTVPY